MKMIEQLHKEFGFKNQLLLFIWKTEIQDSLDFV